MLDLKLLLAKILLRLTHIDACLMKAANTSVPVGTSDARFNPNSSWVLGGGTFSKDSSNRIIVNEACTCIIITSMVFSAISNTNAIKVVGLGKNLDNTEIAMAAVGYPSTWTSLSALDVANLNANDVLHFTGRCASGTNTLRQANIAVIRVA